LDGTLVDLDVEWEALKGELKKYFFENYGMIVSLTPFDVELDRVLGELNGNAKRAAYKIIEKYELMGIDNIKPNFNAIRIIKKLKGEKKGLAIFSSNTRKVVKRVIDMLGVKDEFDIIIAKEDVNKHKPHPEGLKKITNSYSLGKDRILFIGNDQKDMDAGKKANIKTVMISDSKPYQKTYTNDIKVIGKNLGYRGEYIYLRYEKVSEMVNSLNGKILLHVGCGIGALDHYLSPKFRIHGIDISKKEIYKARNLANIFGRNFTYDVKDILKFKPKKKYNIVLCSEVIEHLHVSEREVIEALKSFVNKNGFIVITVPNKEQLRNRARKLFGLPEILMDRTHVKEYNYKEIEKIIEDNGLKIEKKGVAVLYFPLENFIKKIIAPKSVIRNLLIRMFPHISSHLIYICRVNREDDQYAERSIC